MNNQDPGSPPQPLSFFGFPGYTDFFGGPSLLDDNFDLDCGLYLQPLPSPTTQTQFLIPDEIPSPPPIAKQAPAPLFKVIRKARVKKPKPKVEEEGTYAMLESTASTQAFTRLNQSLLRKRDTQLEEGTLFSSLGGAEHLRLLPSLPQAVQLRMMTGGQVPPVPLMMSLIRREQIRKQRSLEFRAKRQRREKLLSKNKNRQAAAFKRTRDPNGKFKGLSCH